MLPKEKAYWNLPDTHEFHYNQAILRKVDKKRTENTEFKAWVHQIMSLNHLASDKIEQTFRELCAIRIPLSAYAKKEKQSFQLILSYANQIQSHDLIVNGAN